MNAKIRFRRKFPSKCNKPIVKWYKPHGAIQKFSGYPQENSKLAHIKTSRRCANYGLANTAHDHVRHNAQSKLLMNPL